MMKQVKRLGQVWILGVLILLAVVLMPKDVYATQISGGSSEIEAVEIQPNTDYISGENGWFQITVPEEVVYIGVYRDGFTDYSCYGTNVYSWNNRECSGIYKTVAYKGLEKDVRTIKFNFRTTKAEQCKFKVVYGGENLNKDNAKEINWNQEYTYIAEWEPIWELEAGGNYKYYKFVAPKSGYVRLKASYSFIDEVLYDVWTRARFDVCYKDDSNVMCLASGGEYGELSDNFYVNQGMTYYLKMSFNEGYDYHIKFIIEDIPVSSIILNATSLTLKKGGTYLLEPTVMPYNAVYPYVEFSSSNENVATVTSDGWITAKKAGTATITVSSTDGSGIQTQCIVNVPDNKKLKVGQKITLNAMKYRVKSTNSSGGTVEMYGVSSKSKKSYKVPNKIKVGDYSYKVEKIGNKAFYNCKSATKITIGTNVKSIGKLAFGNCKKLKILNINTKKLKSVGKQCFKNVNQDVKIYVPGGKIKAYAKLMKNKGIKWIK